MCRHIKVIDRHARYLDLVVLDTVLMILSLSNNDSRMKK